MPVIYELSKVFEQGVQDRMVLVVSFFEFLKLDCLLSCCYIDLEHDVEAIFLPYLLTAFGIFF